MQFKIGPTQILKVGVNDINTGKGNQLFIQKWQKTDAYISQN